MCCQGLIEVEVDISVMDRSLGQGFNDQTCVLVKPSQCLKYNFIRAFPSPSLCFQNMNEIFTFTVALSLDDYGTSITNTQDCHVKSSLGTINFDFNLLIKFQRVLLDFN